MSLSKRLTNLKNTTQFGENNIIDSTKSLTSKSKKSLDAVRSSVNDLSYKAKSSIPYEYVKSNVIESTSGSFNYSSIIFYLLLIILLAFLGFNIFTYLAGGTNFLASLAAPITYIITKVSGDTSKTALDNVSQGTQKMVDLTSNTTQSTIDYATKGLLGGIDNVQKNVEKVASKSFVNPENNDKLFDSINKPTQNKQKNKKFNNDDDEPEPIRTDSLSGGYCYIGKINDTRYCAKVASKNYCMSGDVFPTMESCVSQGLK
jgi:hypothetical protein